MITNDIDLKELVQIIVHRTTKFKNGDREEHK